MESVDETHRPRSDERESLQAAINTGDQTSTARVGEGDLSDAARPRSLSVYTFFSSGDALHPPQFRVRSVIQCAYIVFYQ